MRFINPPVGESSVGNKAPPAAREIHLSLSSHSSKAVSLRHYRLVTLRPAPRRGNAMPIKLKMPDAFFAALSLISLRLARSSSA